MRNPSVSSHSAQAFNQPVQLIHRRKLNRQLARFFTFAVALDLLFNAHFYLGHQQVGQLFFHPARVAAFFNQSQPLDFQASKTMSFAYKQSDSIPLHDCANVS